MSGAHQHARVQATERSADRRRCVSPSSLHHSQALPSVSASHQAVPPHSCRPDFPGWDEQRLAPLLPSPPPPVLFVLPRSMKRPPLADLRQQPAAGRRAGKAAKAAAAEPPPGTPPPEMSALHAPVQRGWGRDEWAAWCAADDSARAKQSKVRPLPEGDESGGEVDSDGEVGSPFFDEDWYGKFMTYWEQREEACNWAGPEEITVKVSIRQESAPADATACAGAEKVPSPYGTPAL